MSLGTLFLRIAADSSRLTPEVEGASAEAGEKAAAAYQKAFNARMRGQKLYNTEAQAVAAGKRDGEQYAASLKKSISKAGKISFVALVAGAVVATKQAADFQSQLTRLVTSAGEAQKNLGLVSRGILNISVATGTSTKQLADGMYLIESAGFHGSQGLQVLSAAARGAKTENADLKDVSDAVTTALKDYNLKASDSVRVTNTYIAAVSHGKTTFQEFTSSLSTVQALAASAHISLADLTGVLATLTDHGVSAQEATQQMAFAIRNLQAPNNVAINAMENLGISSTDVAKKLGDRGLSGTILYLSHQILQKMGPSGLVLLNSMNQSAAAALDAKDALAKLPPAARDVATAYANGKISLKDYRDELKALPANQAALVRQWQAMNDKAKGFSNQLKAGTPQAKTYEAELKAMLGGANGLQVALQLGSDGFITMEKNVNATTAAWNKGGKSVSGFAAVQKTANFQFAAAKESLNKIAIEFGAHILPPATKFFSLLANHEGIFKGIVITLGVMVGLMAQIFVIQKVTAFVKVISTLSTAMKGLVGVTIAEDAAADANPIGLITLAIEALIAAIILVIAYHKQIWSFMKTVWGAIWGFLKTIGAWFAGPFVNFFKAAGRDIAAPFLWLWHNVIDPAWQGIVNTIKFAVAVVKAVIGAVIAVVRAVGAVFLWLHNNIVVPVFNALAIPIGIFRKICELVFKSVELVLIITGRAFVNFYNFAIAPNIRLATAIIQWAWGKINAVFHAIVSALVWVGNGFVWLWQHAIVPAWNAVVGFLAGIWNWLYAHFFKPQIDLITALGNWFLSLWKNYVVPAWNGIYGALKSVWDVIVKDVFNPLENLVTKKIPSWFDSAVKGVGKIWSGLQDIAKLPIKFFVNTVLDDGLIAGFNWVADKVDKKLHIDPYKLPKGFASGGFVSGPGTGRSDSINARLSDGEFVVNARSTSRFLPLLDAINRGALPGFKDGGLFSGIWDALTDPLGTVKKGIQSLIGKIPGAGVVKDVAIGTANKALSGVLDWITGHAHAQSGGYSGNYKNVKTDGTLLAWVQQAMKLAGVSGSNWLNGLITLIARESGGNPNAINLTDSNAQAGDPSRGLMQTIGSTFEAYRLRSLPDNIYDPIANIVAGIRYILSRYGGNATNPPYVQQMDASKPPMGYRDGGAVGRTVNLGGVHLHGSNLTPGEQIAHLNAVAGP
jgi:hypothetical protein